MNRTALVAGAAGFIGSHLVDRLLSDGWSVVGVDNLSSGRASNLAAAQQSPRFQLLRCDLRRPVRFPPADRVWDLASPASPPRYQEDPIGTLEVNSFGTRQLLEHAHRCSARFVLASTSEVYGDPQVHPQPESYWGHVNPVGPRSCYDEGKRFAEALALAWHRQHGLDVRIARIFNTYGPRMAPGDGRVIPTFFRQAKQGMPLTVVGRGRQTRSFCYIDDLVGGLVRLAEARTVDGPVNLGSPTEEVTILRLAGMIQELTGSRSRITFLPRDPDDPRRRRPDIRKARKVLGWKPSTPLRVGLERMAREVGFEAEPPALRAHPRRPPRRPRAPRPALRP